jgi:uncharacterized protein (TIRG00374 family)
MRKVIQHLDVLAQKIEKRRIKLRVKERLPRFKFTRKSVFFTFVAVTIVYLIFLKFSEIQNILLLLTEANPIFILLAVTSQTFTYFCAARIYKNALKLMGAVVPTIDLFKIAIVMLFLNQALPSMGTSGNAFLFSSLNKRGVSSGKSTLAVLLALLCYIAGVVLMVVIAFLYLIIFSSISEQAVTGVLIFLGVVVLISFIMFFILTNTSRMLSVLLFFRKIYEKLTKQKVSIQAVTNFVDDLYASFAIIKERPSVFFQPYVYQIILFSFDCLTIYLLFRAFGFTPAIGVVLVGYAIATLFYVISFTPGGLGTFEASMVLGFTQLAVPLEIALIVTLLFRGLAFWLPMPVGLYLFRKLSVWK